MIAVDTNILVHAHRAEMPKHEAALAQLRSLAEGAKSMPAPATWRVGPTVREHVVDEFLASVARLRELVRAADGTDLGVGLSSPASGLIRMNLGDALRIMVVHCHRHLAQAERTRRAVGM